MDYLSDTMQIIQQCTHVDGSQFGTMTVRNLIARESGVACLTVLRTLLDACVVGA